MRANLSPLRNEQIPPPCIVFVFCLCLAPLSDWEHYYHCQQIQLATIIWAIHRDPFVYSSRQFQVANCKSHRVCGEVDRVFKGNLLGSYEVSVVSSLIPCFHWAVQCGFHLKKQPVLHHFLASFRFWPIEQLYGEVGATEIMQHSPSIRGRKNVTAGNKNEALREHNAFGFNPACPVRVQTALEMLSWIWQTIKERTKPHRPVLSSSVEMGRYRLLREWLLDTLEASIEKCTSWVVMGHLWGTYEMPSADMSRYLLGIYGKPMKYL